MLDDMRKLAEHIEDGDVGLILVRSGAQQRMAAGNDLRQRSRVEQYCEHTRGCRGDVNMAAGLHRRAGSAG